MVAAYGGSDWDLIEEKVLIGANWVDASNPKYRVNATGGHETVTLTTSNLPSHNHSYTYRSSSTGSTTLTTNQIPSHNHTPEGDNDPYFHCWIPGGTGTSDGIVSGSGLGVRKHTSSTGGGGSHYHSISGYSSTTGNTGSDNSFSILPPYKAVYIWTRTA